MMHIPVLNQLETRTDWVSFFRRERSYAYVQQPLCLIDLQSTYLQLTLLDNEQLDGRSAIKYSLGSRRSVEPAWRLIKSCNWQLSVLVAGLNTLGFDSNVRDNSFLQRHTDLTVRKFFAKDKQIIAPSLIGQITPTTHIPSEWNISSVKSLLSHQQYKDCIYLPAPKQPAPMKAILLRLIDSPKSWTVQTSHDGSLLLFYRNKGIVQLTPDIKKPVARLRTTG
ncbi:hypothetical protein [Neptunomonas phycophila]|uniref:hypothetical protein n=1 Tax=Neptunomonas phycophila TaxID=1572645 RepID=UPI001115443D|nr:hypothetical protein [Neptunomonas phycophila]